MKKCFVFFSFLFLFIFDVYSFWIWSPKTGKWKNPEVDYYTTPSLHLKSALDYFNKSKYKQALKEFKKIITHYPDSKEASEAQYYIAKCLEALKKPYHAFLEYNKLIITYPNSKRIQEALAGEFNIGKTLLAWRPKHLLGVPLVLLEDHPSVEIFKKIVETSPHSEYAPKALYELGLFFVDNRRYEEAEEAFNKLIENYPESALAEKARYKSVIIKSKSLGGADYDFAEAEKIEKNLEEFLSKKGSSDYKEKEIYRELNSLREKEAKRNFDIASFYEKQGKIKSAIIYYKIVVDESPNTSFAKCAKEKIKVLEGERK